jgi:PAT family beta-lactamase induction signal transducer AmpG
MSGYLQNLLGYPLFFIMICVLAIPGIISLLFIPLPAETNHQTS